MRGTRLFIGLIAFGTACGSSYADAPSAADAGADAGAGPSVDGGVGSDAGAVEGGTTTELALPPKPGEKRAPDGADVHFAINKLDFGEGADAWKTLGYDLDGKITAAGATDVCKPRGSAKTVEDGAGGRDNSFGRNILPLFVSEPTKSANDNLAAGKATIVFRLEKLGIGTMYGPMASAQIPTLALPNQPKHDGSDTYPLDGNYVTDGDPTKPRTRLSESYLVDNTWVSGPLASSSIVLPILPGVPLSRAIVSMQLSNDHQRATNGVIAGILSVEATKAAVRDQAGHIDSTLCDGATIESILQQVENAADIMLDGSQDPTKTCDGISVGVAFEAEAVKIGGAVTPEPTMPACP